jgi:hypothetical protein
MWSLFAVRYRVHDEVPGLKAFITIAVFSLLLPLGQPSRAQSAVTSLALGPDRIGEIKTAPGITTMIRFPDPVQEIICGDLYDAATGKGTFVVQRSGTADHPGNEVFVKPVSSKGLSNMFVKTGDGKHTYSFDLSIVSTPQAANRMVNVTDLAPVASAPANGNAGDERHSSDPDKSTEAEQQARQKAAEILRSAQQQADRKIAEADQKITEAEKLAPQRADQEIAHRFLQAMMLGLREMKVTNTRVLAKKAILTLDPRVLIFADRAYLRYTVQNTGDKDFTFASVSIELSDGKESKPLTAEVNQSKSTNLLAPSESLSGVIVFDPKQVGPKQRLTLFMRGEGSAELAHLTIQE